MIRQVQNSSHQLEIKVDRSACIPLEERICQLCHQEVDLEEEEDVQPMKVFFCSRTHSQLSQFVKELQRTVFSSSLKAVTLGSRKSLCINPGTN